MVPELKTFITKRNSLEEKEKQLLYNTALSAKKLKMTYANVMGPKSRERMTRLVRERIRREDIEEIP